MWDMVGCDGHFIFRVHVVFRLHANQKNDVSLEVLSNI